MKLSKKLFSLIAVFGLIFAGCSSDSEDSDKKKVTIAVDTDSYVTYFEDAGKAFEEETGITVEVVKIDSMTDYLDDLSAKADNAEDLFILPNDRIGSLVDQKLLYELNLDLSGHLDNAITATTYEDSNYMLPMSAETTLLIRNTDKLADVPSTLEEIGTDNFLAKYTDFYFAAGMFTNSGAYIFGDSNTDIGLATPEAIEAGKNIQSLYESGSESWIIMQDDSIAYDAMMEKFLNGEVDAIVNGPWAINDISQSGINYAVSPIPSFNEGGTYKALSGMKGIGVNNFSDTKEEAKQFVEFLNTDEYAKKWVDTTAETSPNNSVEYEDGSVSGEVYKAVEQGYMMPNTPAMQKVWVPMSDALKQIAIGEDVESALKAAEDAIVLEVEAM